MFKFLDLKDKGAVNFALFEKTAEKMGMYFPSAELQQLFDEYMKTKTGASTTESLLKLFSATNQPEQCSIRSSNSASK